MMCSNSSEIKGKPDIQYTPARIDILIEVVNPHSQH